MRLAEEGLQEAGRRIGRNYRVIKKLGHGGDGTIYLVEHVPTEQLRAAKLLKADMPERRRHELDMMKRLRHPALPQIYDVLEEQGDFWIVMEFIKGKTLSRLCAEEKIGAARFYSVARQLSDALVYLHSRKPPVLHLDIKPSNIMIQPDGTITLIDFGAAARADTKNGAAACFGTPGFAAPEQWDPKTETDARADQYGYGAVLYYCLYGWTPGASSRLQKNKRSGEGKRFGEKKRLGEKKRSGEKNTPGGNNTERWAERFGWRREASSLVRRCMQEDRDRRFPDTFSLYRAVKKAEKRYLIWKKARRSSAAVLLLFAATVFAAVSLRQNGPEEVAAAAQTRQNYEQLLEQAEGLGFTQAVSCYEQAAGLCPEDGAWCDSFLGRLESDYSFSLGEEEALKKLLFSVPPDRSDTEEELLKKNASGYGNLAYRVGLLYWYFYEGTGGKQAAAKWFGRAVAWQESRESTPQDEADGVPVESELSDEVGRTSARQSDAADTWLESARIHAKIGSYYESLGRQDPDGGETAKIGTYWEDLMKLWQLDNIEQGYGRIRCELAQELLSVLIMQSAELKKEGVTVEQMRGTLSAVELFLEEDPEPEQTAATCREQYQAAVEAVERCSNQAETPASEKAEM